MNYLGTQIIESHYALKQTKERLFPQSRHRSARILKKLIKRYGGEFRMEPAMFWVGSGANRSIIAHPERAAELRRMIDAQSQQQENPNVVGAVR